MRCKLLTNNLFEKKYTTRIMEKMINQYEKLDKLLEKVKDHTLKEFLENIEKKEMKINNDFTDNKRKNTNEKYFLNYKLY